MSNVHYKAYPVNQKKKKKKKKMKREEVQEEGKKKVKKSNIRMKPYVQVHMSFSSINQLNFLTSAFSPFWWENFLVSPKRKHLDPTIYFPSSSLN